MDPSQRVLTALNRKEPDKIPFDLGGTLVTGMHQKAYSNLLAYLSFEQRNVEIFDIIQQLAKVDVDVKDKFQVDVEGVFPQGDLVSQRIKEENYQSFYDPYGIKWSMPKEGGLYYDMKEHPLSDAKTPDDLDNYSWPNPKDPKLVKGLRKKVKEVSKSSKRAIAMGVCIGGLGAGIFEMGFWLRGYKNFYLDLGRKSTLLYSLLDKLTQMRIKYWDMVLDEVGDLIQVAIEADDLGTQESTMISPETYRHIIKPRHQRVFQFIKKKAPDPIYVFLHSDGAIYDLIPDLIECGVDILNPVQVSAKGMDAKRLKRNFGRDICFWGGGVDSQNVLPHATPDKVRDTVRKSIDDLAAGGGFVFAPIHNIQADVPPENIMAMWEALQEYGSY